LQVTTSSSDASVLLDLDGTLIDSEPGILSSCRAALRALGHEPSPSLDVSGIIGPPVEEIMRSLLRPYGDRRIAEAVAAYRADYGERGLFGSLAYPGIPSALAQMRRSFAGLYIATSKRTRFARRILERLELAHFFDAIHGSEEGGTLDHKSELVSHVLDRHGIVTSRCVMVGDRRHDVVGAHANGIRALGVLWGYGSREELESAGVDGLVAEPAGLPEAALMMAAIDIG
jgi:phosphoglycolate phosphatase